MDHGIAQSFRYDQQAGLEHLDDGLGTSVRLQQQHQQCPARQQARIEVPRRFSDISETLINRCARVSPIAHVIDHRKFKHANIDRNTR